MGDHIIYGPNWGVPNSDKVFINHYSGKTDTHQDFLRQIRIYGDPLRKKSGGLRWLSGKKKKKNSPANPGDLGPIPGLRRSLEEGMATHSSILAWRIPWTEEPGRLQIIGLQKDGHDRARMHSRQL